MGFLDNGIGRRESSFKRLEVIALFFYAILVIWMTAHHEPWADEAQSWLIARDSSLGNLFFKRLHYEGTPGLWHFLLWVFSRLHFSYTAMHWATAVIGVITAYVVLRYAPFPAVIRVALSFGFALVFQTAVIARSYSLVPLLVFLICVVLTGERNRPITFAFLAGLLANTSLIGFLFSLGLVFLYLLRLAKAHKTTSKRSLLASSIIITLLFSVAFYTALPAPDVSFGLGPAIAAHPAIRATLSKLTGLDAPPLTTMRLSTEPATAEPIAHTSYLLTVWRKSVAVASLALFPVSSSTLLALVFYAVLLTRQAHYRALLSLIPLLMLVIGGIILGLSEHHSSILWTAIIAALWLTWNPVLPSPPFKLQTVFQIVFLAVLIEQVAWAGFATWYSASNPFDGSVAAARFLIPQTDKHTVAGFDYHSISVQPFASKNVFDNQPTTYWPWKTSFNTDSHFSEVVAQHPDFILDGESYSGNVSWRNQIIRRIMEGAKGEPSGIPGYLQDHGYHETHRFCGRQPAHFGFSAQVCEVIYEPLSVYRTE